jgi:hypothetical protein
VANGYPRVPRVAICEKCGLDWHGSNAFYQLNRHECIGFKKIVVDDILRLLRVTADDHNCLLTTQPHRFKGPTVKVPSSVYRFTGEGDAPRAILTIKLGRPIRTKHVAAHECGPNHYENHGCLNPDHIHERTYAENRRYMGTERISAIAREALSDPEVRARMSRSHKKKDKEQVD